MMMMGMAWLTPCGRSFLRICERLLRPAEWGGEGRPSNSLLNRGVGWRTKGRGAAALFRLVEGGGERRPSNSSLNLEEGWRDKGREGGAFLLGDTKVWRFVMPIASAWIDFFEVVGLIRQT